MLLLFLPFLLSICHIHCQQVRVHVLFEYTFPANVDPNGPDIYFFSYLGEDVSQCLYYPMGVFNRGDIRDTPKANISLGSYAYDEAIVRKKLMVEFYDADPAGDADDHFGDTVVRMWDLIDPHIRNPDLEYFTMESPIIKVGAAMGRGRFFSWFIRS